MYRYCAARGRAAQRRKISNTGGNTRKHPRAAAREKARLALHSTPDQCSATSFGRISIAARFKNVADDETIGRECDAALGSREDS